MGEVRLLRPRQNRGWTPARLAEALRHNGFAISKWTINRECLRGVIPCETTPGGHRRISPDWIAQMYPALRLDDDDRGAPCSPA